MEKKTDIAKFISFLVRFFRFVSVNEIEFFPLMDISVSVNINHTVR